MALHLRRLHRLPLVRSVLPGEFLVRCKKLLADGSFLGLHALLELEIL